MTIDVAKLLGKSYESEEVQDFVRDLGIKPKVDADVDRIFYLFKRAGAALRAEPRTKRIDTIFLHSNKERGFSTYQGPLPHGVTFSLTIASVEKLLGKPDLHCHEEEEHSMNWEFDDYKLSVDFDPKGRITGVTVTGA